MHSAFFYVHGSVHCESMSITVQQDATIYSLLYFCNCSTCFVWNSTNCTTTAEGSRDGLTSARCCNYNYMCSWWWVDLPPETCRAVYRNIINCIQLHLVGQLLTLIHDARTQEHKIARLQFKTHWHLMLVEWILKWPQGATTSVNLNFPFLL